jgi:cell division protein FtsW (lipid II flippase)
MALFWLYPITFLVCAAICILILVAKGFDWWIGLLLGLFGPLGIVVAAIVAANAGSEPRLPPPPTGAQWVADPTRRHELRLWDGHQWTAHVSDGGVSAYDPLS